MKVSCQSCGAKYTILDDKVVGRKVKVRCKSCGTPIVVDGTESGEAGSADAAQAGTVPFAEGGDEATRVDEPSFDVSDAGSDVWSVNLSDTDQRDLSLDQIVEGWNKGEITSDAFVWKEGMGDWIPILDAPELRQKLGGTAQSPKLPTAPKPTAARVNPRREQDLFGASDSAGRDDEVMTSAGASGKAPPAEQKATGARNESSVLFSLDALKAGVTAQAPSPKRAPPRSTQSSDPFDMGGPDSLASLGGGVPLFGAPADQAALLTAPAPEPPKPPPAPKHVEAAAAPAASLGGVGRSKPNMKLILGAGAGIVVLLAIAAFAFSGGSDEEEVAKNDSSEKADVSTPTKSDEPEKKAPEAKVEEKKAEPAASATAEVKKDEPKPDEKKSDSTASATTSKTDPAAPKDTTTKAAPEVKVKEAPSDGVASFNTAAAKTALATAAAALGRCRKEGGPTGAGKAIVTFAPSGRVTSANVTGAFAGTSVGGCVASVFRNAKVPAFSGSPVTVSKSFSIQ
jgi:predicted Zn finger-like uncharacterized protein